MKKLKKTKVPPLPLNEIYRPRDELLLDISETLSDKSLHPDIQRLLLDALGQPIEKKNALSKANRRDPPDPYFEAICSLARKLDRDGVTGKAMRERLRTKFKHLTAVSDRNLDRRIKTRYRRLPDID